MGFALWLFIFVGLQWIGWSGFILEPLGRPNTAAVHVLAALALSVSVVAGAIAVKVYK